jgi:prevent-host-death family protein
MAMKISIRAAQARLEELVDRAAGGEEMIITKGGERVVVLRRYAPETPIRQPGGWKGKARILPGFDEADKEIEAMFYGEYESNESLRRHREG